MIHPDARGPGVEGIRTADAPLNNRDHHRPIRWLWKKFLCAIVPKLWGFAALTPGFMLSAAPRAKRLSVVLAQAQYIK